MATASRWAPRRPSAGFARASLTWWRSRSIGACARCCTAGHDHRHVPRADCCAEHDAVHHDGAWPAPVAGRLGPSCCGGHDRGVPVGLLELVLGPRLPPFRGSPWLAHVHPAGAVVVSCAPMSLKCHAPPASLMHLTPPVACRVIFRRTSTFVSGVFFSLGCSCGTRRVFTADSACSRARSSPPFKPSSSASDGARTAESYAPRPPLSSEQMSPPPWPAGTVEIRSCGMSAYRAAAQGASPQGFAYVYR